MKNRIAILALSVCLGSLVFKASNHARIEKPLVVPLSPQNEIFAPLELSTPFQLTATDPLLEVVVIQAPGYSVIRNADLAEEGVVIYTAVLVPPGSFRSHSYKNLDGSTLVKYDAALQDLVRIIPEPPSYADWKPWGKVQTKYYSPWLFEPVKIC